MKKIVISLILILSICLIFSFSSVFANEMNNAANGVRNVVGGAENVVEDAAKDATGAVRTGLNTVGNATENTVNDMNKDINGGNMNTRTNDNYTATRTSADSATGNFLGNMGNNAWTWIVVGIVVLAIIALIWYYSTRQNSYNNHDDE